MGPKLDPLLWRGKKLFLDFDDTLVQCSRAFEPPDERGWGPRGPIVPLTEDFSLEVVRVNAEARALLAELRAAGAMCIITSAASSLCVERVSRAVGLAPLLDGVFAEEHLSYRHRGFRRVAPKDYSPVIEAIGVADPLASCVVVGNDPTGDVPLAPLGLVTALTLIDFPFGEIIATLGGLLERGEGSFVRGFDALVGSGSYQHGRAELEDEPRWKFLEDRAGRARLVYFDRPAIEADASQFLWLE